MCIRDRSIYDFIMSDNKFSTPKGAPPNQVSPLTWMLMTGFFQQLMMKSGLKTGFGRGGVLPEADLGAEIMMTGAKGYLTYLFGQSIYDFLTSDNKFSTPRGAPSNQLSPFMFMAAMGGMQQMFMANMPTQLGMGGSLPEAKRGEGILDMLSADKNSTVFYIKDDSL